jgi:hypothetical protein
MRITVIYLVAVLAALTVPANAEVMVNDKTDISLTVFVPCAASGLGETVDLSGPLFTLISFTMNANSVSGYFHFQANNPSIKFSKHLEARMFCPDNWAWRLANEGTNRLPSGWRRASCKLVGATPSTVG